MNLNTTGALTDNITLASEDNDTARILLAAETVRMTTHPAKQETMEVLR